MALLPQPTDIFSPGSDGLMPQNGPHYCTNLDVIQSLDKFWSPGHNQINDSTKTGGFEDIYCNLDADSWLTAFDQHLLKLVRFETLN